MSNKPKGVKSLVEYTKTPGERSHERLVKQAKAFSSKHFGFSKHIGSKPNSVLHQMREKY
jgi:hypothetical protein